MGSWNSKGGWKFPENLINGGRGGGIHGACVENFSNDQ